MMTYLALLALVAVAALLFKARGVIAVILCTSKMRAGDYDGALRIARWASLGFPNPLLLHKEALTLLFADRPAEAEVCCRKALDMAESNPAYRWERLYSSLGSVLIDLARYDEAEQCFHRAIEMGDLTGNSQDGLAELRLVQGVEAEKALDYAGQAIEHAKRRPDKRIPGAYYAHRAWALGLLGRVEEARAALAQSLREPKETAFGIGDQHWRAGMALVAMQQPEEARKHFQMGHKADPRGTYGRRCGEHLA
jgi:tetratricopeptide (TPR) repeat protein